MSDIKGDVGLGVGDGGLTLRSVRFGTGPSTKSSIGIVTFQDVGDGELAIEFVEHVEVCKGGHGAVEEASICFAPSISLYRSVVEL